MNNLKALLEQHNIKPKDLAEYLGVDVDTIYNWQNGKRDIATEKLKKIAQYLQCTIDEILGYKRTTDNTTEQTYTVNDTEYKVVLAIKESDFDEDQVIQILKTLRKRKKD